MLTQKTAENGFRSQSAAQGLVVGASAATAARRLVLHASSPSTSIQQPLSELTATHLSRKPTPMKLLPSPGCGPSCREQGENVGRPGTEYQPGEVIDAIAASGSHGPNSGQPAERLEPGRKQSRLRQVETDGLATLYG